MTIPLQIELSTGYAQRVVKPALLLWLATVAVVNFRFANM